MVTALMVVRNEAEHISRLVSSLKDAVDEVLVVDTGSEDQTSVLAKAAGARVEKLPWQGYGATKNAAAQLASHDWILSLDGDELPDPVMLEALRSWHQGEKQASEVLGWKRITSFGEQWVRYGNWSRDYVWRLYHRKTMAWSLRPVHESLESLDGGTPAKRLMKGELRHFSFRDLEDYRSKHENYARLGAESLAREGVSASWQKRYLAPAWRAFRGLVLRGGWRDGALGWRLAVLDFEHVSRKYQLLNELQKARIQD